MKNIFYVLSVCFVSFFYGVPAIAQHSEDKKAAGGQSFWTQVSTSVASPKSHGYYNDGVLINMKGDAGSHFEKILGKAPEKEGRSGGWGVSGSCAVKCDFMGCEMFMSNVKETSYSAVNKAMQK